MILLLPKGYLAPGHGPELVARLGELNLGNRPLSRRTGHVRRRVFEFIEGLHKRFYNRDRLHSSLGHRTLASYEAMLRRKKA